MKNSGCVHCGFKMVHVLTYLYHQNAGSGVGISYSYWTTAIFVCVLYLQESVQPVRIIVGYVWIVTRGVLYMNATVSEECADCIIGVNPVISVDVKTVYAVTALITRQFN